MRMMFEKRSKARGVINAYERAWVTACNWHAQGKPCKLRTSQVQRMVDNWFWKSNEKLHPGLNEALVVFVESGNTSAVNEYFDRIVGKGFATTPEQRKNVEVHGYRHIRL